MQSIKDFFNCLLGPRLYRIYTDNRKSSIVYTPNALENWSDNIIKLMNLTYTLTIYTSPLIIIAMHRRGYFSFTHNANVELTYFFLRIIYTASILGFSSLCLRSFGRLLNNDYKEFITKIHLINYNADFNSERSLFANYDFDFTAWPIEYSPVNSNLTDLKKLPKPLQTERQSKNIITMILDLPLSLFYSIVVRTIGRRMIYPGSVSLLQLGINDALNDGRKRLIERFSGQRFKISTLDKNTVDVMFVDRRGLNPKGNTLVICSEGNAGFYEIGTMITPIEAGYSVIGWNHPGFGYSTGLPYPEQVVNAVDAVLKFSIDKLNFEFENIIVFAWSIGGYPASWLVMQYPELKSLILDASFDDILPLGISKMPISWKPIVRNVVRRYFDLNISLNLKYYSGPVLFIRRLRDEIIFTNESEPVQSNRANNLLINLLNHRFPGLIDEHVNTVLFEWLSSSLNNTRNSSVNIRINNEQCYSMLRKMLDENGYQYPVHVDEDLSSEERLQLALFLATKHILEFDSTHCSQLPVQLFIEPWDLFNALKQSSKL